MVGARNLGLPTIRSLPLVGRFSQDYKTMLDGTLCVASRLIDHLNSCASTETHSLEPATRVLPNQLQLNANWLTNKHHGYPAFYPLTLNDEYLADKRVTDRATPSSRSDARVLISQCITANAMQSCFQFRHNLLAAYHQEHFSSRACIGGRAGYLMQRPLPPGHPLSLR